MRTCFLPCYNLTRKIGYLQHNLREKFGIVVFCYTVILWGWYTVERFTIWVMGELIVFKLMSVNCCVLLYSNIVGWYNVERFTVWVMGELIVFKLMSVNCCVLLYSNIVGLIYCRVLYSMSYGRVGSV
jgi:hypothetical protein